MPVAIKSTGGGSVTLTAPSTASDYTLTLPASSGTITIIPSGTVMLFAQTSAPTGWTKSTTHDNKALRVVSGAASSGGSVAFTTAFASQTPTGSISVSGTVGATTLSTSQIPSHNHTGGTKRIWDAAAGEYGSTADIGSVGNPVARYSSSANYRLDYTSSTGGGGSHDHSFSGSGSFTGSALNLAVQYVDVIIASKD
jgi:hypothetical protein